MSDLQKCVNPSCCSEDCTVVVMPDGLYAVRCDCCAAIGPRRGTVSVASKAWNNISRLYDWRKTPSFPSWNWWRKSEKHPAYLVMVGRDGTPWLAGFPKLDDIGGEWCAISGEFDILPPMYEPKVDNK